MVCELHRRASAPVRIYFEEERFMKRKLSLLLCLISVISILLSSCSFLAGDAPDADGGGKNPPASTNVTLDDIPEFDGETPYVVINGNVPFFTDEKCDSSYESYSELDALGRCGVALACLGPDLMPTEEREEIGHVLPSGWHSVKYDSVPGKNLYNRCHLIGFQLAGENDNEKNLITGTRNMNNDGMLPYENKIADYIEKTGNHVLYRVTPMYEGYDLVARGVLMEAKSIEDDKIRLCIYVYNCQPGIIIDYKTGESRLASDPISEFINSNHDESEILPALAPDSVTEIYAEYISDGFSGCLVVVRAETANAKITVATDVSEEGKVLFSKVIKGDLTGVNAQEVLSAFVGKNYDEISAIAPSGDGAAAALKGAVLDALSAFKSYTDATENGTVFIVNTNTDKFHKEDCRFAPEQSGANALVYIGYAADLVKAGYSPCGTCKPAN